MSDSYARNKYVVTIVSVVGVVTVAFLGSLAREITRSMFTSTTKNDLNVNVSQRVGSSNAFTIGDRTFGVEQPTGFVLLEDRDTLSRIVRPPDNQLHLAFIPAIDAARIMNGGKPVLDRYITIQSNRKLDPHVITPEMFQTVIAKERGNGVAESIERNKQMTKEFLREKDLQVDDAKVIGFAETQDSYTVTILVKMRGQAVRVNTVTMRNLRGCCIVLATTSVCRTEADIEWVQSATKECAESLN